MRSPCACGSQEGRLETRGGQDCVFCTTCGKFRYNAPKTETGRKPRTVASIHAGIKPAQRARILLRATGRCELDGTGPTAEHPLHVGHLLSVQEGIRGGLTDEEINSDENLAALCDACNLGIGGEVIPLRLAVAIVLARLRLKPRQEEADHEDRLF